MALVVLLILAMVWILVLAPAGWKKLSGRHAGASIESFHHELRLLEHSGPKLIAPAFRLETAQAGGSAAPPRSGYPTVSSMPGHRPLVLLQANAEMGGTGHAAGYANGYATDPATGRATGYADSGTIRPDGGWETGRAASGPIRRGSGWEVRPRTGASRRARHRRRNTLGVLAGTALGTGLLGLAPSMHVVWILTGLSAVALAGYLGLAAYAQTLVAAGGGDARAALARPPVRSSGGWYDVDDRAQVGWGGDGYEDDDDGWDRVAAAR